MDNISGEVFPGRGYDPGDGFLSGAVKAEKATRARTPFQITEAPTHMEDLRDEKHNTRN